MANFQYLNLKILTLFVMSGLLFGCQKSEVEKKAWEPSEEQLEEVTSVSERKYQRIKVGEHEIEVEVVDTAEKVATGLSYREKIGSDGMLFVFPRKEVPTFWMRGMRFGLDMVWIECSDVESQKSEVGDCVVVDVSEHVPAPENPDDLESLEYYSPRFEVTHVLEVPAGWVDENGVEVRVGVEIWKKG